MFMRFCFFSRCYMCIRLNVIFKLKNVDIYFVILFNGDSRIHWFFNNNSLASYLDNLLMKYIKI